MRLRMLLLVTMAVAMGVTDAQVRQSTMTKTTTNMVKPTFAFVNQATPPAQVPVPIPPSAPQTMDFQSLTSADKQAVATAAPAWGETVMKGKAQVLTKPPSNAPLSMGSSPVQSTGSGNRLRGADDSANTDSTTSTESAPEGEVGAEWDRKPSTRMRMRVIF